MGGAGNALCFPYKACRNTGDAVKCMKIVWQSVYQIGIIGCLKGFRQPIAVLRMR